MDKTTGIIAAMTQASPAPAVSQPLSRRGLERLDLMLLCVEALDFNGGEAMLWMTRHLGYGNIFPNRVEFWKRRCYNPLRRSCRRGVLDASETDALIRILCRMADRLYPMIRALLTGKDQPELQAERWELFQERLAELMRERMNPRRSGVQTLIDPQAGSDQRRSLVQGLALGSGDGGFDRLKASLMDAAA